MNKLNGKIALLVATALLTITACGGGGGGGITPPPPPPPVVRTPQLLAYSASDGISTNGRTELYSIDDDGQNRVMLSDPMPTRASADIAGIEVSPDKQWIAYLSDQFTGLGWHSLYVAPIDGSSAAIRVSRQISFNGSTSNRPVQSYQWSPDSTRLVYSANLPEGNSDGFFANQIYIVNRDGTGEERINGSIGDPAVVEVTKPQWSPDGRFVVQEVSNYAGFTQQTVFGLNVYDTAISTPNSRRLFTPRAPAISTTIRNVRWSPDSTRISYMADQLVANEFNVFVIDVVSEANMQVTDFGDFNSDARWSPDGSTLAFLDNPSAPFPSDLVVSAGSAGAQDTVLAFLSPNGRTVTDYAWSPDGQQIAYTSDETTQDTIELYVVNADGSGAATRVSGALATNGDVFDFAWSPAGDSIAYVADQATDTFQHLYVSSATGATNTSISLALNGEEVVDFAWAVDAERIAFSTGPEGLDPVADKLYVAEPDGTGRLQINNTMDTGPLHFTYDE